jgi:hypothetical protein
VKADIGVGMADEAMRVLDLNAAQPDMIAPAEAVDVEALSGAYGACVGEQGFGHRKILWRGEFEVQARARYGSDSQARVFGDRCVVGERGITSGAMGG